MFTLRDDQIDVVNQTRVALRSHRSVLVQAPTGFGKTVIASDMLGSVAKKQKRGFFICHRKELVDQTALTFDKCGIPYGYIAADYPSNFYQPIQICSIDTLKNRLNDTPQPDFVIWDEAHHLGAAGWENVHKHYEGAYHVGLSATPQRRDGKGLDDRFSHLILGPEPAWLIETGRLAEYDLYSVPGADMSQVTTSMGDFAKGETEHIMGSNEIVGGIIEHWKKYASDKLTIGFAITVRSSRMMAERFCAAGIPAVHLDGETKKPERRKVLRRLAMGEIRIVFNVGLFAEGFDIAANSGMDVTIGCVIDAAPSQSLGAWLQRCGRTLRPQEGRAVILDHAGNYPRHGAPCDHREWSLEGIGKSGPKEGGSGSPNKRQCPKCFKVDIPGPVCLNPECGHVFAAVGRVVKEIEGELVKIDPSIARQQLQSERAKAQTPEALKAFAAEKGYKKGYEDHVTRAREQKNLLRRTLFNLISAAELAGVKCGASQDDIQAMKPKKLKETIAIVEQLLAA